MTLERFKYRIDNSLATAEATNANLTGKIILDQEEKRIEEAALEALEDIARQETVDLSHVPTEALKKELKRRGESVT
jgi:hypothetical protein